MKYFWNVLEHSKTFFTNYIHRLYRKNFDKCVKTVKSGFKEHIKKMILVWKGKIVIEKMLPEKKLNARITGELSVMHIYTSSTLHGDDISEVSI